MAKYRKYLTSAALATVFAVSGYVGSAFAEDTGNIRVWFMQSSVSDQAIDWLETEFAAQNPGSTLTVEVQPWADIVSRLLTSLASKTETPDIVELGNTKTATFGSVGALADVTDLYGEIDGDNLIPSFVTAATINDKIYAYPLYAGTSVLFYRKDLFEKAGIDAPETIEDLVDATIALEAANPEGVEGFKGIYFPVIDTHGIEGWLFTYGANYAHFEDGKWKSGLDTAEAKAAFEQLQKVWTNSALGALDGRETAGNPWVPYNDGEIGMFSYRAWAQGKISDELRDKTGVMALPPAEAGGKSHQFLGGSNVAISASSQKQELAKKGPQADHERNLHDSSGRGFRLGSRKRHLCSEDSGHFGPVRSSAKNRRDVRSDAGRAELGDRRREQHPDRPVYRTCQGRKHRRRRCARRRQDRKRPQRQLTMSPTVVESPPDMVAHPRRRRRRRRGALVPYFLIAPLVVTLTIALGWPLFQQFVMSFQKFGLAQQFGAEPEWIGFGNYIDILSEPDMWLVFARSVAFCVIVASISILLGGALALLLTKVSDWARILLQVSLLLMWSTPILVMMVVWQWLFDGRYGLVNWILTHIGFVDMAGFPWTSTPMGVFFIAGIAVTWGSQPLIVFMIHAALTQVPSEVLEAAELDGAGPYRRFVEVTLPLILPAVMIVGLLQIVWDLRVFTQIYVLQQAGVSVDETNLLGTYIFRLGIGQGQYGAASALATVVLILTLLLTWPYIAKMFAQQKRISE